MAVSAVLNTISLVNQKEKNLNLLNLFYFLNLSVQNRMLCLLVGLQEIHKETDNESWIG